MKILIPKIGALVIGFALVGWSARPQSTDDRSWTDKHFMAAFDEFFPIEHAEGDFIAVRAHRDGVNDVPEFSVVLENTQTPRAIRGILREAQGAPLYQQLLALHAKDPSRPFEQLKQDLKMQEWEFSAAQCPAVAAQFQAFSNIQFVRPRDDDAEDEPRAIPKPRNRLRLPTREIGRVSDARLQRHRPWAAQTECC